MNSLENWSKLSVIEFDFFSICSTKKLLEKSRSFYLESSDACIILRTKKYKSDCKATGVSLG